MTAGKRPASDEVWEVVVATLYDTADHGDGDGDGDGDGAQETSFVQGTEEEARRVYADRTAEAADRGYHFVTLTCGGEDVESWPQATGWTS